MSPDSSPKSAKSDPIEAVKEDAETTATRKELKNTSISGIMEEERAKTPDSDSAGEKDIDLKDRVLSPKKKRARDQLEDEKALETEASDAKDGESKVDMPSPKKQKHNGQVVGAISPTALRSESWNEHLEDEAVGVHPRPAALGCGMDDPTASAQRLEPESPREAWPVAGNQMEEEEASYLEDKQDGEVSPEGVENQEGESLNAPTTERPDSIQHDANHTREKDRGSRSEPEKKRHRDELSPTSDAVAATTVPTAVHPGKKPESDAAEDLDKSTGKPTTTSGSAFAQSGFSKLSQAASPFGALGGTTAGKSTSVFGTLGSAAAGKSTSVFGGGAALASSAATKPAPSLSFKQTSGPSPFGILGGGSKLNGFGGGFGGGFPSSFASAAPSGRLSSFAKPGETFGSSTKNEKPFGAPDSDNEEDESGNEDEEDSQSEDNGKAEKDDTEKEKDDAKAEEKKKKLQMVEVDDGEDGEATVLQVRAKLYYIDRDNKEAGWKERGAGTLKINVPESCVSFDEGGMVRPGTFDASALEDAAEEATFKGVRLIMRQDHTHKLLLNTGVLPAMKFHEKNSLKSSTVLFTAFERSKEGGEALPVSISMKMSAANARLFLDEVDLVKRELQSN